MIKYNKDGDKRKITDLVSACREKNPTAEILISSDPKETVEYLNAGNNPDNFAKSVLDFINENNLDGFDMDWESEINAGCMYKLLNALKIKFLAFQGKKLKLTLAVNPKLSAEDYGLKRICLLVDQINLMSYGATRPLVPSAKNFCDGGMSVYNIIGGIETEIDYSEFGGHDTLGDTGTIKQKCDYARTWNFAGMFEWRLDNDLAKDNKPTFKGALDLHDYTSLIPDTIEIFFTGGENRNMLYGRVPGRGIATFLHEGCQGRPFASGEWVYFRGIDNNLYKCKSNGPSYDGWWARNCFSDPFVCGEYVYFQGNNNSLVRININTGIEQIVQESGCYSIPFVTITDNNNPYNMRFYSAYYKGGKNNSESNRLMCSKSDGSLVEIDYFCWSTPFVSGDYVYFQGGDNSDFPHLYKKKISDTLEKGATLVATNCGGSPFLSGDWVYYQGGTNRGELYRINIKQGFGSEQLLDSYCGGQPFVTDCWVYFLGNTEKNQLYRRQVNGGGSAEFVDSHCGGSPFITGVLNHIAMSKPVESIYPVNISNLNNPEDIITLQALQGIIAQNSQNQLFLYNTQDSYYVPTKTDQDKGLNTADEFWLNYITNDDQCPKFSVKPTIMLEDAIREFKDYIKGYSIYSLNDSNSMNLAASYAGLTGYIPLTQEQYNEYNSLLTSLGITCTITIDGNTDNFLNKYKNDLDQNMVFELNPTTSGNMPRDYAAMNKALVCYSSSSGDMKDILGNFSSPIAVFGWNELGGSNEKVFISTVSNAGDFVVPCDWGHNLSLLSSSWSAQIKANQSPMPQITYDENKKYVTFLVSDGDNLQLWLNTANDARWWGNNYRTTKNIPVGWTIPPAMYYLY